MSALTANGREALRRCFNHEETLRATKPCGGTWQRRLSVQCLGDLYGLATRNVAELKEETERRAQSIAKEPYFGLLEDFSQKMGCGGLHGG